MYWKRRGELEADVATVEGFLRDWNQRIDAETLATNELTQATQRLVQGVDALPRPEQGANQLKDIQQQMDAAKSHIGGNLDAAKTLVSRVEQIAHDIESQGWTDV